jgi:hypothetical protein
MFFEMLERKHTSDSTDFMASVGAFITQLFIDFIPLTGSLHCPSGSPPRDKEPPRI